MFCCDDAIFYSEIRDNLYEIFSIIKKEGVIIKGFFFVFVSILNITVSIT